jgi:GNAT superfamily N-acetyltransferase
LTHGSFAITTASTSSTVDLVTRPREASPTEAFAELVSASLIEPVALDTADERTWADCDLASLAENRLGVSCDPRAFDERLRQDLRTRATTELCGLPSERRFESCFWLLEGGARVGTVALESAALGTHRLRLSSLYLLPDQRGKGLGARALQRLKDGLGRHGFGIRLETSWCWPAVVRFYLREGLMLHGWKRELTFTWDPGDPPLVLGLQNGTASASIEWNGIPVVLARAERAAERLVMSDETLRRYRAAAARICMARAFDVGAVARVAWLATGSFPRGLGT